MTYVQVAVNVPTVSGIFDYHLPPELQGQVSPGCLVVVPFGKQTVQGLVTGLVDTAGVMETRPVQALLDPLPAITPTLMKLAQALAHSTLAPLSACLELMLPPGLSQQADTLYHLVPTPDKYIRSVPNPPSSSQALAPLEARLVSLLEKRGPLRGRQIETALPHHNWKGAAQKLVRRGLLISQPVLPPPSVRPRHVRMVQLACPPQQALQRLHTFGTSVTLPRRQEIIHFLIQERVPVSVAWVYAASGGNLQDLQKLAEQGLVILSETEVWRDPLENLEQESLEIPSLTTDQKDVLDQVLSGLRQTLEGQPVKPHLLHGVTGSGKTEIYLQAAAETLRRGKQVIILVPEIALTPQALRRFAARFPGQVGLVHSRLSPGERYDTWRRARMGALPVIVGPRSALFTPLPNPGLIVLDECHDDSYYQSEIAPAYHAVQAAILYSRLAGCLLLLGSATPDVSLLYRARQDGWPELRLPQRILAHRNVSNLLRAEKYDERQSNRNTPDVPVRSTSTSALPLPPVSVVDMRQELKEGNRSIFSRSLREALQQVLAHEQQAILFLNRRGSATYVFCRECGASLLCPRCDRPLVFHSDENFLICHTCNYHRKMPTTCPSCSSRQIRQYGTGVEKVEAEVLGAFPGARTLRWDAETTRQKGSHDIILSHFSNHHADILVGTQMLAKGLDLPLVTLVGVVLADVGLNLPDFRAAERTFQVLTQVAGRAGRSPLGGQVILQTFQPEAYPIQAAARHDFEGFYRIELEKRRKLGYPPFSHLARLEFRSTSCEKAEETAQKMAEQVRYWIESGGHTASEMIGPVPCFFSRVNGQYRWQVILRGPDPASILRGKPLGDWRVEIDPPGLL